ncbi:hypothetical protein M3Y97_00824400 [Aphelenchoides bicaudatus]|nr:hypothetical protein M3Y97_00824400 [Aphelenchoides bicaudatus]
MSPDQKKRKLDEDYDLESSIPDKCENLNSLASEFIDQLQAFTSEVDQLGKYLPESFDELQSTLKDVPQVLKKLEERMTVAKARSQLDPDNIQSTAQFGINPLFLTEKFALKLDGRKRKDWSHVSLPTHQIVTWQIGNVTFDGVLYQKLTVKGKKYPNCTGNSKSPHLYGCSFSPTCNYQSDATTKMLPHIITHFDAPVYFCIFCRASAVQKSSFCRHLKSCAPYITDRDEIDAIVDICKKKTMVFADFQFIARQFWNDNQINLTLLDEWSSEKLDLFVKYFEFVFRLPPLNSNHPSMLSLNGEFTALVSLLCAPSEYGNNAELYGIFETTGHNLTMISAPIQGRYAGSECNLKNINDNKNRHRQFIEDTNRQSSTFHSKLRLGKDEGLTFSIVTVLKGIRNDFKQTSGNWNRARFTIEDALKTMFEALSDDLWNKIPISRNKTNDTYSWPTEKRMLLGRHILQNQWNLIETGLADVSNIL